MSEQHADQGREIADDAELEPAGTGQVDLIAAALRADAADTAVLMRVLSSSLGDMLPTGMVEVQRSRTLSERLSGREGRPVALTVVTPDVRLSLTVTDPRTGLLRAETQRLVRGVVISRQELSVDAWVRALAQQVADLATRTREGRLALDRLLRG